MGRIARTMVDANPASSLTDRHDILGGTELEPTSRRSSCPQVDHWRPLPGKSGVRGRGAAVRWNNPSCECGVLRPGRQRVAHAAEHEHCEVVLRCCGLRPMSWRRLRLAVGRRRTGYDRGARAQAALLRP